MRLKYFTLTLSASFLLTACVSTISQQAYAQPPSVTQIQAHCLYAFKKFSDQTKCIEDSVASYGVAPSSYVQEYLAYMQTLQEKLRRKALSESDARAKLTSKLSQIRALEQKELATQAQMLATQEQLENERTAQSFEMLSRIKPYQHPPPVLQIKPRTQTDCQMIGAQLHCTSQ
jgi:hypothetical protein